MYTFAYVAVELSILCLASTMGRQARSSTEQNAGPGGMALPVLLLAGAHALLAIAVYLNWQVQEPYMDEIFHLPQTQRYCAGQWAEWDPMITTFPGLYLVGVGYAKLLGALATALSGSGAAEWLGNPTEMLSVGPNMASSGTGGNDGGWDELVEGSGIGSAGGGSDGSTSAGPPSQGAGVLEGLDAAAVGPACTLGPLRTVNILQAVACAAVLHALLRRLHPQQGALDRALWTLALCLYPLHFFYTFLYYTDVGALAWLLLAYLLCLQRRYKACALVSAAAVALRQTNAVWAAWLLAGAVLERSLPPGSEVSRLPLHRQLGHTLAYCWQHMGHLLADLWPMALTPAAFALFVVANGGVVVGDRTAHQPTRHGMQLAYCVGWVAACLVPVVAAPRRLKGTASSVLTQPLAWAVLVAGLAGLATQGIMVHPYLLADNRHYTFYIWRRLLSPGRYALVPAYAYSAWTIGDLLCEAGRPTLWTLALLTCTAVVLVPAWLLEFRYAVLLTTCVNQTLSWHMMTRAHCSAVSSTGQHVPAGDARHP